MTKITSQTTWTFKFNSFNQFHGNSHAHSHAPTGSYGPKMALLSTSPRCGETIAGATINIIRVVIFITGIIPRNRFYIW